MIEALISGKLFRDCELKTSSKDKPYCNFMLSVNVGEPQPIIVSGIAFGEVAEQISALKKGDALSVAGALKPSQWTDKTSGETKHGFNVTVTQCLTAYDARRLTEN